MSRRTLVAILCGVCLFCVIITDALQHCSSSEDCLLSQHCIDVPIGGEKYCVAAHPNVPRFPCSSGTTTLPPNFQCCNNTDCKNATSSGVCTYPNFCGGPVRYENVCAYDQCVFPLDCGAKQSCMPRGFHGLVVNSCMPGDGCKKRSDCHTHPGGECSFFYNPCCSNGHMVVACTYAASACRSDADCPEYEYCTWKGPGGNTSCEPHPPCPK